MAMPESVEAHNHFGRLLDRLLIETGGDARAAFELLVVEHCPDERLWFVFLWQAMEEISPSQLAALADKPGPLRREGVPSRA